MNFEPPQSDGASSDGESFAGGSQEGDGSKADDSQLDELLDMWEESVEAGKPLSPEQLCEHFPNLLEPLRKKVIAIERMNALISDDRPEVDVVPLADKPPNAAKRRRSSNEPSMVKFDSTFVDLQFHERGGIGAVYRAVDSKLNRSVAIKFINGRFVNNKDLVKRFRQEAEITGRLDHPGVVPVYAIGETEKGEPFYSMRFIKGDSLDGAIKDYHRLCGHVDPDACTRTLRNLLQKFVSVCRTIAYAHTRGIVHRDIKPQNVMLGKYGETLVVDWGLALPINRDSLFKVNDETTLRPSLERSIQPDMGEGTPVYMSPEQVSGKNQIMPSSDIFSLGVTLFKLLTGKLAFDGETPIDVRQRILKGTFPKPTALNPEVASELESICLKAMSTDPTDRYETASALADDVENWLAGVPVQAHHYSQSEKLTRWSRRHQGIVRGIVGGTLALCLASMIGALLYGIYARNEIRMQGDTQHALQIARRSQGESLQMTSQVVAQSIATELHSRINDLEDVAQSAELIRLMTEAENGSGNKEAIESILESARCLDEESNGVISWFALNRNGELIARSSDDSAIAANNQPRWMRPYFHGGELNLDSESAIPNPISRTSLSPVFRGVGKGRLLYSLSTPVRNTDLEIVGVIAKTVQIGQLNLLQQVSSSNYDRFVSLSESRGELAGTLIHHTGWKVADITTTFDYQIESELIDQLSAGHTEFSGPFPIDNYEDPLGHTFAGDWVTFALPVSVRSRIYGDVECGWYLIVQDRPFETTQSVE